MDNLNDVAKEVHMRYYSQGKFGKENEEIKEICKLTGASKKEVKKAIYDIMHPWGDFESIAEKEDKERRIELRKSVKTTWDRFCETCSSNGGKVARCPKCKSTSISYGGNRPSIGRAVVGGALAGPAGATIGGLTGKKGYCVCMNCGKRWKI